MAPLATLALLFALAAALAGPARALDMRALAGWWIAIDDTFPGLWENASAPLEEILIVNPDGRFENRVMNFWSGSAQACAERRVCGDLPLVANGRLRIAGDRLALAARASAERLDSARADPLIRRAALSATANWTIASEAGLLTLSAARTRRLARIEPQRLRRLRAGMRVAGLAPERHWRCFLANAMAHDPAFAPLGKERAAPEFLERFLRVASYLMSLDSLLGRPTPDDPAARGLIGFDTEELLVEEFAGLAPPGSRADAERLAAHIAALESRVRAWMAAAGTAPAQPSRRGPISDAEIAAFALAASEDPAAKKLFCRE